MKTTTANANTNTNTNTNTAPARYQPAPEPLPPFCSFPFKLKDCALWLWYDLIFPYGIFFLALAALTWEFFTPEIATMRDLHPNWMLMIWLRNTILLILVAGGLHWLLYIKRRQAHDFKFDPRWQATNNRNFWFRDQVKDNMFWSLLSGGFFWSLYEALTLWWYASGRIPTIAWSESPLYLVAMLVVMMVWGSLHFYLIHRLLHWKPLYRIAHELHHRNVNVGPWSGISMHPLEHLLYFSSALLWWFLPAHPTIIIAAGFFTGLGPAFSHCGFEKVKLGKHFHLAAGTYHHQLHHRYFEVNYGNPRAPMDFIFGTWHDGSETAHARFLARRTANQR